MTEETKAPVRKKTSKKTSKKAPVRKKAASRKKAPVRKKAPARKKVAAKKELTTEEQFEIEVAKDSAGFSDVDTKTVTARDTADAIQQMDKDHPEGYDAVSIEKKSTGGKPTTAPVAAEPVKAVSKTAVEAVEEPKEEPKKSRRKDGVKVDVNTFELTEDFDSSEYKFPYSIVLPLGYEDFVSLAVGRSDQPIMVVEHRGRLKTTLESEQAMDDLVKALVDMVENDNHKDKATMLIKGIMGSLRKR